MFSTIKSWLKERHWARKLCRCSHKAQQKPAAFQELHPASEQPCKGEKRGQGKIDPFDLYERGIIVDTCITNAWRPQEKTLALLAIMNGRENVMGLNSRQGTSNFQAVETTITSAVIAEAMANFIRSLPNDKLTVIIMDNALPHRKTVRESQADWLLGRVSVWFLSAYSPEMNLIKILWKKIKYEWLSWAAYTNIQILSSALQVILENYGDDPKYQVNFI